MTVGVSGNQFGVGQGQLMASYTGFEGVGRVGWAVDGAVLMLRGMHLHQGVAAVGNWGRASHAIRLTDCCATAVPARSRGGGWQGGAGPRGQRARGGVCALWL
jgi:hypothetical protein